MADDAVHGAGQRAIRGAHCRHPGFGMEALDLMGIDIDQDPRAFARFLELKTLMQERSVRPLLRQTKAARRPQLTSVDSDSFSQARFVMRAASNRHRQRGGVCIEFCFQPDRDADRSRPMSEREPAQDGHAERMQLIAQQHQRAGGEVCELADGIGNPGEVSAFPQHGHNPVGLSRSHIDSFEEQNGTREFGQRPSGGRGDHLQVSADQPPLRPATRCHHRRRFGARSDGKVAGFRQGGVQGVVVFLGLEDRAVNAGQPALLPQHQMQDGVLADSISSLGSPRTASKSMRSAIR